ncbi:MAG: hypothetical protein QMD21_06795 [Candidatus Thermoplasmatota archaeon]|nr:hypothetical protein [Candidatus Thermoplasmatota archaeon]MDI6856467.1 hypothetical protein [Candidatus Thermoplasmatota archaeon]
MVEWVKKKNDSDVDIIVVTPKLYGEWHKKKNYPVDILLFNVKEFEKLKKQVSIVSEALREGIET